MATYKYGSWVGAQQTGKVTHRAFLLYTLTTNNDTTYTLTVSSGVDPWNNTWGSVTTVLGLTGRTAVTRSVTTSSGANYTAFSNQTFSYTKGHTAQTITISATSKTTQVDSSAGGASVNGKTSTASYSFTVPAKTSYTVTFDANGGDGAPANQTKWYGETLTLPNDIPVRENYRFLGWDTSDSASTATYAAGGNYTTNAGATLYAVWERIYVSPSISNLDFYRTETASSTEEDEEGNYLYITFDYVAGHYAGLVTDTPVCIIKIDDDVIGTPVITDSGSVAVHDNITSYTTDSSHSLKVTIADNDDPTGVTESAIIPSTTYPIELSADGTSMDIGVPLNAKKEFYITLDENASSGTDYELIQTLTSLGWWHNGNGGVLD